MYTSRNIAERPYSLNINTKLALAVTAILTEKILISETGSSSRAVELDHIQEEIEEVSAVPEVKEKKKSRNALRKGSEGEEVRAMQEASQKLGFYLGEEDMEFSSFSSGTERAVKTWQALCALLSVLDDRGKREALLIESLEKRIAFLCQAMSSRMVNSDRIDNLAQSDQSELDSVREDTYSPVSDVDNNLSGLANDSLPSSGVGVLEVRKKGEQQKQKWSRIQAFDSWLWNSFYLDLNAVKHGKRSYFDTLTRCESCHDLYWRDEKHCRICHTTFELHFDLEESTEDVLQLKRFQATHVFDRLEENRTSVEDQPRNELSVHGLDNLNVTFEIYAQSNPIAFI
ncbi:unnamed protein product [Prunus armeniaca]